MVSNEPSDLLAFLEDMARDLLRASAGAGLPAATELRGEAEELLALCRVIGGREAAVDGQLCLDLVLSEAA